MSKVQRWRHDTQISFSLVLTDTALLDFFFLKCGTVRFHMALIWCHRLGKLQPQGPRLPLASRPACPIYACDTPTPTGAEDVPDATPAAREKGKVSHDF